MQTAKETLGIEDPELDRLMNQLEATISQWPTLPGKERNPAGKKAIAEARDELLTHVVQLLEASGSVMASVTQSNDDREVLHFLGSYMEGVIEGAARAGAEMDPKLVDLKRAQASRFHQLAEQQIRRCRFCGCSEDRACPGGCSWVSKDPAMCSSCVEVRRVRPAPAEVTT